MAAHVSDTSAPSLSNLRYMFPIWIILTAIAVAAAGWSVYWYYDERSRREEANGLAQAAMSDRKYGVQFAERLYRSERIEVGMYRDIVVAALRAGKNDTDAAQAANDSLTRVLDIGGTRASRLTSILGSLPPQLTIFTSASASSSVPNFDAASATLDNATMRQVTKPDIKTDLMVCSSQDVCDGLGSRLARFMGKTEVAQKVDTRPTSRSDGTPDTLLPTLRRIDFYIADAPRPTRPTSRGTPHPRPGPKRRPA